MYRHESWYQKHQGYWPYIASASVVTGAQYFNLMTLATIVGYFFHFRITNIYIHLLCMLVPVFVLMFINFRLFTKQKYKSLKSKHKNEKHKTLKGYGVLLYEIGSFALIIICQFVFSTHQ